VRRRELVKRIAAEASRQGVDWSLLRHDAYVLGGSRIPVPRHSEIKELTAQDILAECGSVLGEDWWNR
jgi:hypothetical protein